MNETIKFRLAMTKAILASLTVAAGCYGWAHLLALTDTPRYGSAFSIGFSRIIFAGLLTARLMLWMRSRRFNANTRKPTE